MCGKICKDVFTLQRHIAIVHEERKYKCDECEATFKQQKNVKRHKDSVHLKKHLLLVCSVKNSFHEIHI